MISRQNLTVEGQNNPVRALHLHHYAHISSQNKPPPNFDLQSLLHLSPTPMLQKFALLARMNKWRSTRMLFFLVWTGPSYLLALSVVYHGQNVETSS